MASFIKTEREKPLEENLIKNPVIGSASAAWTSGGGAGVTVDGWNGEQNLYGGGALKVTILSAAKDANSFVQSDMFEIFKNDTVDTWLTEFYYWIDTGATFVDEDLVVEMFDGTSTITVGFLAVAKNTVNYFSAKAAPNNVTGTNWKFRIRTKSGTTTSGVLRISDVKIKRWNGVSIPAIGEYPLSVTSNPSDQTTTVLSAQRVGSYLTARLKTVFTGTPNAFSSFYWDLGGGISIDTTKIDITQPESQIVGMAKLNDVGTNQYLGYVYVESATRLRLRTENSSGTYTTTGIVQAITPITWSTGDVFIAEVRIPIAQWSTSVPTGDELVEYASNSGTTATAGGTNASTLTKYGQEGSNILSIDSTTINSRTTFDVAWKTPIKSTDIIELEILPPGSVAWIPISSVAEIYKQYNGTWIFGAEIISNIGSITKIGFANGGRMALSATYAAAGAAWSVLNTWKWRLVKRSGGLVLGSNSSTSSGSGLINFLANDAQSSSLVGIARSTGSLSWSTATPLYGGGAVFADELLSGQTIDINLNTVDPVYGGQVWQVDINYHLSAASTGGTTMFADGELVAYLLDGSTEIAGGNIPIVVGQVTKTSVWVYPTTNLSNLKLRIKATGTSKAADLRFADISVRPQQILSIPAASEYPAYTPIVGGATSLTDVSMKCHRMGKMLWVSGRFAINTPTSAYMTISLPPGLTLDIGTLTRYQLGRWNRVEPAGANTIRSGVLVAVSNGSVLYLQQDNYDPAIAVSTPITADTLFSSGNTCDFWFLVPIAQWSSSVQVSSEDVEYAYNSDTSTTNRDDATYAAYGIEGVVFGSYVAFTRKRVYFKTPIKATDSIDIELQVSGSKAWIKLTGNEVQTGIASFVYQNGVTYGIGFQRAVSAYEGDNYVSVAFGQYGQNSGAYGAAGTAWSSFTSHKWRVVKRSGGSLAQVPPVVRAYYSGPNAALINVAINFSNKIEDTHNAVSAPGGLWRFTAPIKGLYKIEALVYGSTANHNFVLVKNSSAGTFCGGTHATGIGMKVGATLRLGQGEWVHLQDGSGTMAADGNLWIMIDRIGD